MNNIFGTFNGASVLRIGFGMVAIAILSFLYIKTQSFDQRQHNNVVSSLSKFKQIDAILNQDVIESRTHLLNSYDPLVRDLSQLHIISNSFITGPYSIYQHGQPEIDLQINTLKKMLSIKEGYVERFKSDNAILNNSLKYFPVINEEMAKLVKSTGDTQRLSGHLSKLLTNVLIYNLTSSPELKQQINNLLDHLISKRSFLTPDVASSLDTLISHTRTILDKGASVDILVSEIVLAPTSLITDNLSKAYQSYVNKSMRLINIYRYYLYLFSITLLAYIIHILFVLRQTADELAADVTKRKQTEAELFSEKERALVTLESIGDAVITTGIDGHIEYLNPVAESLTGWANDEAHGMPLPEVFHVINDITHELMPNPVQRVLQEGKTIGPSGHALLIREDGAKLCIEKSAAPIRGRDGCVVGVVLVFRDVTSSRQMAAQLKHQASHDALTELINRREFEQRLERALDSVEGLHTQHALLYLDLDQFKIVNDTCGHAAGDQLLRQITHRLQMHLRERDTLARLGGDEFGILLEHCPADQAFQIAEQLRQTVCDFYFIWHDKAFAMGVSIGMVSFCDATMSLGEVLSAADTACYIAKDNGRNRVHIYHSDDSELALRHVEMEWVGRIRKAFDEGRFRLYSQEILPLQPTSMQGAHAELLVRIVDERGSLVAPMAFIPAAERYNLMPTIDRWVVHTAFTYYAQLHDVFLASLGSERGIIHWTINLSGASLCDEYFLEFVQEQFERFEVPHKCICFEITETTAISNLCKAVHIIEELRKLGCRFSLDDFGIGVSSFAYLKHLPVDYLKIDGSFIKDMAHDPIDRAMVEAINNIGHVMGIKTIAEFVEDKETLALLGHMGVDYAQGYGISKPQPFNTILGSPLLIKAG